MANTNKESELFFLNKIKDGTLILDNMGNVYNTKTKRKIGAVGSGKYFKISMKDLDNNIIRHINIHRLMWLHFKGPILENHEINHIDGNKLNNNLTNLEIVTPMENTQHAFKLGLNYGRPSPNRLYSNKEIIKIRLMFRSGKYTKSELATKFNTNKTTIFEIITGMTYSELPFIEKRSSKEIRILKITKLIKKYTVKQISQKLNCSVSTINRLIKEIT